MKKKLGKIFCEFQKAIFIFLFFFNTKSYAADSIITINGNVRDNTCSVSSESKELKVNLLPHATKNLKHIGDKTATIPFYIKLSPCGASSTAVKVGFSGNSDIENANLLGIESGTLKAKGLGILILDSNKNVLSVNEATSNLSWINLRPGIDNILTFYAQLVVSSIPVTAGNVSANATFILEFQ